MTVVAAPHVGARPGAVWWFSMLGAGLCAMGNGARRTHFTLAALAYDLWRTHVRARSTHTGAAS